MYDRLFRQYSTLKLGIMVSNDEIIVHTKYCILITSFGLSPLFPRLEAQSKLYVQPHANSH